MSQSSVIKNFRDGTIVGKDATGTPITHTFTYDPGDVAVAGLGADMYEILKYLVRGELASVRKGNRRFGTVSFTAYQTDMTEGPMALIMKSGTFSSGVSTLGANADVWAFTLTFTIEGTAFGDAHDHIITMTDCVGTADFAEGDPNAFKIQAEILGTITLSDS